MSASAEAPTRERRLTVLDHDAQRERHTPATRVRLEPLLAVCGLTGGAGATTVAYLVALAAAGQSSEPVLVADSGGPSGALAALAAVEAPRSLPELASQLAAGPPLRDGLYATGPAGLRVLASGPEFNSSCAYQQIERLLLDAREAHGLTVIDCGTLARDVDYVVATAATHIAWVLSAAAPGVACAQRVLAAAPTISGKEIVVARADVRHPKAPMRELRRIAAERRAPLVLVPHLPALEDGRLEQASRMAQVPVQAILGVLRR